MNDQSGQPLSANKPPSNAGQRAPSNAAILVMLTIAAVALILGYLFLMKLVGISSEEDCILAHRRDCASIEVPSGG
jgi:hypothetical protein